MYILTGKKEKILVDDFNFEFLNKYRWHVCNGYARAVVNGKQILMHRLIMGVEDRKIFIDHKNRNSLDNRICNLRFCNNSENQKNKKSSGKSKYLGVSIHSSKIKYVNKKKEIIFYNSKTKFIVHIKINGKYKHLGLFENEIEAALTYNKYALYYHGEFANINKIKESEVNNE